MYLRYSLLVLSLIPGSAWAKAPSRSAYETARAEADDAAAKWRTDAKLYRIGVAFHSRRVQSHFEYFSPDRPGRWSNLVVTISPESGLTTTQYSLSDPMPDPVRGGILDPVQALGRIGLNQVDDLSIELTRIGEANPTIYGQSRTVLEQRTQPGQWIWYAQTRGVDGGNKLIYVDAVSGQGSAVCWSARAVFAPISCPASK
jgi:hypothetical protein